MTVFMVLVAVLEWAAYISARFAPTMGTATVPCLATAPLVPLVPLVPLALVATGHSFGLWHLVNATRILCGRLVWQCIYYLHTARAARADS